MKIQLSMMILFKSAELSQELKKFTKKMVKVFGMLMALAQKEPDWTFKKRQKSGDKINRLKKIR